jgi:hypothetical protein
LFSLDGEHDRLSATTNRRRPAYLRSRCSRDGTRGIHFRPLPCPCTHTLSHCIVGFPSVRFTRDCRLLRIFLLAASPGGSHHSAVGRGIFAHGSFVLVEPSPPIQHLWNVAPRTDCMERDHLTRRWSEQPPVARSRRVSLRTSRSDPCALPVVVAHLVLVR